MTRARNRSGLIVRVRRYVFENYAEDLDVDTVASAAGASRRTVTNAFKRETGMSVMAYVKSMRLEQARRELLSASSSTRSVTDIALSCGFNHLSKFARDYSLAFGEQPSVTRKRRLADFLARLKPETESSVTR